MVIIYKAAIKVKSFLHAELCIILKFNYNFIKIMKPVSFSCKKPIKNDVNFDVVFHPIIKPRQARSPARLKQRQST